MPCMIEMEFILLNSNMQNTFSTVLVFGIFTNNEPSGATKNFNNKLQEFFYKIESIS